MGFIQAFIGFFTKFSTIKHASSVLLSFMTSSVLAISIETINQIFFKDSEIKNIYIPVIIEGFMILVYLGMVIGDFYYGVRASIKVEKVPFEASRILDTTVKVIATILMTSVVMFLCMVAETTDSAWLRFPAIVLLLLIWLIVILNDYLSIGDNIKKLYGSKPKIFSVVEDILAIIVKKAINSIENNSFNLKKENNEKDNMDNPD